MFVLKWLLLPAMVQGALDYPYIGVPDGASRSPCPALNTLANHGILPNSGRGITAKMLQQGFMYYGFEEQDARLLSADFIIRYGSSNATGILSFDLDASNIHGQGLTKTIAIEHDASLTREDAYFGDAVTISLSKVNRFLSAANRDGILDTSAVASALQREAMLSYLQNPTFLDNFDLAAEFSALHNTGFILMIFGGNQSLSDLSNLKCTVDAARSFLLYESIPEDWVRPQPSFRNSQVVALVAVLSNLIDFTTPEIFPLQTAMAYVAVFLSPAVLFTHHFATKSVLLLQQFPKPKKLFIYLFFLVFELVSFILIASRLLPPIVQNLIAGTHWFLFEDCDYKVFIGVAYFYVAAYTAELLFHANEMQLMLVLHHLSTIAVTLSGFLVLLLSNDVLFKLLVVTSGTSILLHAAVDFIPHIFLCLRMFNAPYGITRVFGWMSVWPLTVLRLLSNTLFVAIIVYFSKMVLKDLTSYFFGWTVFLSLVTLVLLTTQVWAHTVYVAVLHKDAKERREEMQINATDASDAPCTRKRHDEKIATSSAQIIASSKFLP
ncbi:hypothetical protein HDU84_001908 [Entophlyctis sp. JEL0112]|nr:hypothetical protein HDU84_001908 [Entophlyctis sp. JEL0112]